MKEKIYMVKEDGEQTFDMCTEKQLRNILQAFEKDYIKDRIEDLYKLSKNTTMEKLLNELEEIKEWNLDYYSNIQDMDIQNVIKYLKEGYSFTIFEAFEL